MIRSKTKDLLIVVLAALWLTPKVSFPDSGKALGSRLNLERIFKNREFTPERFGIDNIRWLKDGQAFTVVEKSTSVMGGTDIVLYAPPRGERTVLVSALQLIPAGSETPLPVEDYAWSADGKRLLIFTNSRRVWRLNTRGDFWILDLASGKLKKLGAKFEPSTLQFAKLDPSGRRAAYVHNNDIYAEDVDTNLVVRLTWDGSPTMINGAGDWVYEEEFHLRDAFRWSPDGKFIAFWQFDTSGIRDFNLINNTDSVYPRLIPVKYPKAGEMNAVCRIGIVGSSGGPVTWLKIPGDPRDNYVARMEWANNSSEVILQHLNRLQNVNDVVVGDTFTGEVRTIFTDRDKAWVEIVDDFTWLDGGKAFLWQSERDGWNHVYAVSRQSGEARLVTPGAFDVVSVEGVDEKHGWLYVIASPENPTQRYLYRSRLDGRGKSERISPMNAPGTHSYRISPACGWAVHTYSTFEKPPVTDLVRLPSHAVVRILAANEALIGKMAALDRIPVEFFRIDIGDGVLLDGWCLKPPDFDPSKSYPLFFYVYGEPLSQTVLDRWGGSNHLWHMMLAQQGFLVVSLDNRGTPAPRGREWRKSIYRQIGVLAPADQAAGVKAILRTWPFADASRVGVWGWSGGGGMTLHAMFKYPDLYKTGMAVAFISDLRLYDTIYEERYMSLPNDNPEGYRSGSPIHFAGKLKGNLLLVHGTGDDNVHYQNFELLVNELVAGNKLFSMMIYPNRSHSISEGKNTTLHLYETLTEYLNRNLPPGPRTPGE